MLGPSIISILLTQSKENWQITSKMIYNTVQGYYSMIISRLRKAPTGLFIHVHVPHFDGPWGSLTSYWLAYLELTPWPIRLRESTAARAFLKNTIQQRVVALNDPSCCINPRDRQNEFPDGYNPHWSSRQAPQSLCSSNLAGKSPWVNNKKVWLLEPGLLTATPHKAEKYHKT